MGVPVDNGNEQWEWEGESPTLTAKQSALLEATIDEVRASPLSSSVKVDGARSAVWRYLVAAQWRLEPVGGKRVSDFFVDTLKWRQEEGVDGILARAQTFGSEAASGKLFVRGTCVTKRPLIWFHLGRENNALDPEANVRFLIYTVVLARSILVGPEEGPDKYLYMAQLHEGRESLRYYEKGLELLQKQLSNAPDGVEGGEAALKQRMCMAHCSVAELFLTDLCYEEDAESRCQDALGQSMLYDYGGPEPLHAAANLRLSQSKPEEAAQSAQEAFERLLLCEPPPDHEFRVSLAKILMESSAVQSSCSDMALQVLSGLMQEDDENVEVWYLMAIAFSGLQPPDYESARVHLDTAAEMLSKIRIAQKQMGEEFAFEDQVQLVEEQLEVISRAPKEGQDAQGKDADKEDASLMPDAPSEPEESTEMDCA